MRSDEWKENAEEHTIVIAAEVPLPVDMLRRVLRAGWYQYPGGRIKAVDVYCTSCRQSIDRIFSMDEETGLPVATGCKPQEWLHGGPQGTRRKRAAIEQRA